VGTSHNAWHWVFTAGGEKIKDSRYQIVCQHKLGKKNHYEHNVSLTKKKKKNPPATVQTGAVLSGVLSDVAHSGRAAQRQ
jgi:hypothetical protein